MNPFKDIAYQILEEVANQIIAQMKRI